MDSRRTNGRVVGIRIRPEDAEQLDFRRTEHTHDAPDRIGPGFPARSGMRHNRWRRAIAITQLDKDKPARPVVKPIFAGDTVLQGSEILHGIRPDFDGDNPPRLAGRQHPGMQRGGADGRIVGIDVGTENRLQHAARRTTQRFPSAKLPAPIDSPASPIDRYRRPCARDRSSILLRTGSISFTDHRFARPAGNTRPHPQAARGQTRKPAPGQCLSTAWRDGPPSENSWGEERESGPMAE